MENKRPYTKGNPEKQELTGLDKTQVGVIIPIVQTTVPIRLDYQKPALEEIPESFFIIISGGEVREKDYFRLISDKNKFKRIKLEFVADPNRLSPDGLLEIALFKKERYLSSRNIDAEPDNLYLITDVDHFINEIIRIKPICSSEGFFLIVNNPCFEIWLYYAYFDYPPKFSIPNNKLKISGNFKNWLNKEKTGGVNPHRAIFKIRENIENAKKNYLEDDNSVPKLFSTNMYMLAEAILPLIEPELNKHIEDLKSIERSFRKKEG